jgi:hypothetical protein
VFSLAYSASSLCGPDFTFYSGIDITVPQDSNSAKRGFREFSGENSPKRVSGESFTSELACHSANLEKLEKRTKQFNSGKLTLISQKDLLREQVLSRARLACLEYTTSDDPLTLSQILAELDQMDLAI